LADAPEGADAATGALAAVFFAVLLSAELASQAARAAHAINGKTTAAKVFFMV